MKRSHRFSKLGILAALIIGTFIYGFGVGSRQWFPYHLLQSAMNAFSETDQNEQQNSISDDDKNVLFESLRDDTEYHVFLLAGQSNMTGQGDVNELSLEDQQLPGNVRYFDFGRDSKLRFNPHKFGPEVSLAQQLSAQFPDKQFVIFKYAISGASLLDWSPDWNIEKAAITKNQNFGPVYEKFLSQLMHITKGKNVKFSALLWMQGERDARFPEASQNYYKNFATLISKIRSDLGQADLPVLLGAINPPQSRYPDVKIVQDAQTKASQELADVHLVTTDDVAKLEDDVHYSTQGQLQLGAKFARTFMDVISAQETSPLNEDK